MNSFIKALTLTVIAIAALAIFTAGHASSQQVKPAEAEYPVLLVHGLGTGPGVSAFGNLQEYLEGFYFDVEVMDFNDYKIGKLIKHQDADNIPVLAAVLGNKIKDMVKKYNTDKVSIIAHSFGGLIVEAYLEDKGAKFDKKNGVYNVDVNRVLYLQTPFYGTNADPDLLLQLAQDTDYGPYTRPEQMVKDLQYGSQMIFDLDASLRAVNIYTSNVDMATFISPNDEIVPERSGILAEFTSGFYPFAQWRSLKGYRHTNNALSGAEKNNKVSIAYVEKIGAVNFIAISSFMDGGRTWRKFPTAIDPNGILMVKHSGTGVKDSFVTLTMKKKINAPGAANVKPGDTIEPVFDDKTNIFYFYGVAPGDYTLAMKGTKTLNETISFDGRGKTYTTSSFTYDAKKNELLKGDGTSGSAKAIYSLKELLFTSAIAEKLTAPVKGLNTNGFEVTFNVEGAQMELFNKGRVVVFYNQSGAQTSGWQDNGGRLEIQLRGSEPLDDVHAGKIQIWVTADKNKNGKEDNGESDEIKTTSTWNWAQKHTLKMTVSFDGNESIYRLWVDNVKVLDFTMSGAYYNPNPYVSFGGREFDIDYFAPLGAKVTNFEIRNGTSN